MAGRSRGGASGGAWLAVGLAAGIGCTRPEASVGPPSAAAGCNPADDCNDLLGGSTVRQHSERATSVAALSSGCPHARGDIPPLASLDDGSIPEFNVRRSRRSNMNRGDERLQDVDLHAHMMGMHDALFACADQMACYASGVKLSGQGDLDFSFELHPDGHVVAVSVEPSAGLDHPSMIACARRTLASYRFPRYDGGQMMLYYTVTIETVSGD